MRGNLHICFLVNDLDRICILHGTFFIKLFLNVRNEWFLSEHLSKESRTKNLNKHPLLEAIHNNLCTPLINSCLQWSDQPLLTETAWSVCLLRNKNFERLSKSHSDIADLLLIHYFFIRYCWFVIFHWRIYKIWSKMQDVWSNCWSRQWITIHLLPNSVSIPGILKTI